MTAYRVHARRWTHGWELHIDGVGVTQAHSLKDAPAMAREYIALELDIAEGAVEVIIEPEVGHGLDEEAAKARTALREALEKSEAAAIQSRDAVRKLKAAGLTGADVATYLGISPQRVSQLAKGSEPTPKQSPKRTKINS